MPYRADIGAYDGRGRLVLVAEVKGLVDKSPDWAAGLRRNLYARGVSRGPRYFLLALPDRFYLWKDAGDSQGLGLPQYEIDARRLLAPYLKAAGLSADTISGRALELIVSAWLQDLMNRDQLPDDLRAQEPWLAESGLFEALKGGRVEYEVAA